MTQSVTRRIDAARASAKRTPSGLAPTSACSEQHHKECRATSAMYSAG